MRIGDRRFRRLDSGLRRRDVGLRRADAGFRLKDPGVLQFFLPLIVDQRIFAGGYGRLGLLHLRAKIVIPQLDQ